MTPQLREGQVGALSHCASTLRAKSADVDGRIDVRRAGRAVDALIIRDRAFPAGVYLLRGESGLVIGVGDQIPELEVRPAIAHMIGHLYLGERRLLTCHKDARGLMLPTNGDAIAELAVKQFAREYLLPFRLFIEMEALVPRIIESQIGVPASVIWGRIDELIGQVP